MNDTGDGAKKYAKAKELVYKCWARIIDEVVRFANKPITKEQPESPADKAARSTARATILIAIFTVVLAGVGYLQYIEIRDSGVESSGQMNQMIHEYRSQVAQMKRQAGDTHELAVNMKSQADRTKTIADQAVVQANANKQLAQNAVDTLANTKQSFRNEQRAWIGVQATADSKGFTETEIWKITVVFFNSGRTPARNVQTSGMFVTSPVPLSGPTSQQVAQLIFRPAQSIAPQGFYRENIGQAVGAEGSNANETLGQQTLIAQYAQIKNKQLFLYYYGLLKYDDTFGRPHETQYCIYLANPDTKEVGICDSFNDLN